MVKQVRVIRNVLLLGALSGGVLCLVGAHISANMDAVGWGMLAGLLYGWLFWVRLARRIERQNRRYERNKIFVSYISLFELLLTAAAASHYLLIALIVLVLTVILLGVFSGYWWIVLVGAFGVTAAATLAGGILRYEWHHGPLYYQYRSSTWMGGEGLLYSVGTVIQPLTPEGKVRVEGEVWDAVSLSGETIEAGAEIEVISREGLTLYVDRLGEP